MTDILDFIENDDLDIIDESVNAVDAVEPVSLELVDDTQMSEAKARELTNAIKAAAEATYVLLAKAHQGKAYKALGYETWADYVTKEFEISTQRSYQLLNLSKTIQEIEAVAPAGTEVKLTEAQARDIKRELPFITSKVAEETSEMTTDEAAAKIEQIVNEAREQKKLDDEAIAIKEKQLKEAEEEGYRAGLEAGADAILANGGFNEDGSEKEDTGWGESTPETESGEPSLTPEAAMNLHNLVSLLTGLSNLPENPSEVANVVPESKRKDVLNQAENALSWFQNFVSLAKDWE